jgi:hypothetical protein
MFAGSFVFHQNHITGRFSKFGAVTLVSIAGQFVDFTPHQPPQRILIGGLAMRAI